MKKTIIFTTILLSIICNLYAQQNNDEILGTWETGNGKAHVKITKVNNYYFGRIVWLKIPLNKEGKPKLDQNNPDESKRLQPILGLQLIGGFEFTEKNVWEKGTIYDPETGKLYSCKITLSDKNTMNIRGFIGINMLGRTDTWRRVEHKN